MFFYESNDETTTGRERGRHHEDPDELVRALPEGTRDDGHAAPHEGAAAPHRPLHHRKVLHRRGGVKGQ